MRVFDASVVVSALVDSGTEGEWALALVGEGGVSAQLLPAEVGNVLRRLERSGNIGPDTAALAHDDLSDLPLELLPYEPFADRIWALRSNLTIYDAWYVAVAEAIDAELVTLDARLAHAPGLECAVLCPE